MSSIITSPANALTVREVTTRAVRVPLTFALSTSAAIVNAAPLLLVDVYMEQEIVGRSYLFCYTGCQGGGGAYCGSCAVGEGAAGETTNHLQDARTKIRAAWHGGYGANGAFCV